MTKDEALKLARRTLYENTCYSRTGDPVKYQDKRNDDSIKILEEALAQPDPVLAEREACAKLVEPDFKHRGFPSAYLGGEEGVELLDRTAAAIRARSHP